MAPLVTQPLLKALTPASEKLDTLKLPPPPQQAERLDPKLMVDALGLTDPAKQIDLLQVNRLLTNLREQERKGVVAQIAKHLQEQGITKDVNTLLLERPNDVGEGEIAWLLLIRGPVSEEKLVHADRSVKLQKKQAEQLNTLKRSLDDDIANVNDLVSGARRNLAEMQRAFEDDPVLRAFGVYDAQLARGQKCLEVLTSRLNEVLKEVAGGKTQLDAEWVKISSAQRSARFAYLFRSGSREELEAAHRSNGTVLGTAASTSSHIKARNAAAYQRLMKLRKLDEG